MEACKKGGIVFGVRDCDEWFDSTGILLVSRSISFGGAPVLI